MSNRRFSRHIPVAAIGLTLTLAAAACGAKSGASDTQVASLGTTAPSNSSVTATTTAANTQEALLAVAACLREQGLDVADPTFDASGNANGGLFGPDSGIDPRSEEFQTAMEACGSLLEGVTLGGGGGGRLDREGVQESMNDFTACLRDEGLDVDDIAFGAGGPGGGPPDSAVDGQVPVGSGPQGGFGPPTGGGAGGPGAGGPGDGFDPTARIIEQLGLDSEDAAVKAAVETCQSILETAFQPGGTTTTTTA